VKLLLAILFKNYKRLFFWLFFSTKCTTCAEDFFQYFWF